MYGSHRPSFLPQVGNHCLLFAFLNVLPTHNERCKMLDIDPSTTDGQSIKDCHLLKISDFIRLIPCHATSSNKFENGILKSDIDKWLQYLKDESKTIKSFTIENTGVGMGDLVYPYSSGLRLVPNLFFSVIQLASIGVIGLSDI
jgi:hypothetical protein